MRYWIWLLWYPAGLFRFGPEYIETFIGRTEDAHNDGRYVAKWLHAAILLAVILWHSVSLPVIRWIGLPRRIAFWQAMMLHRGLYFKAHYDAEYEETLRAQELLERL